MRPTYSQRGYILGILLLLVVALQGGVLGTFSAEAGTVAENSVRSFYEGKTLRIVVGFGVGGGFDIISRLIARHMWKYIPGKPKIFVQNRPGAGSIIAANAVYATEPQDGTVILSLHHTVLLQQALKDKRLRFDARKFKWLGSTDKTYTACVARTDSSVRTIEDVIAAKELTVATQARGTASYDLPMLLNATLGTKLRLISGYTSVPDMFLAIQSKEAEGICIGYVSVILGTAKHMLEGPKPLLRPIVVMGSKTPADPFLEGVPAAEGLAKSSEARLILRSYQLPSEVAFPYAVGPGVPADRVKALQHALQRTYADPDFLAEAAKAGRQVNPSTAEETTEIVEQILDLPPEIIRKLTALIR